jgi:exodeoxyribonuclease VIII
VTVRSNLPFESYISVDAVHFSTLKSIDKSPLHYRHACDTPREYTPALRLGRLTHSLLLSPEVPGVAVYAGRRAGKEWETFEAAHAGESIVKVEEIEHATEMREAIKRHAGASALFARGRAEVSIEWLEGDLACKARLDWLGPSGVIDLKTTRSIDVRAFTREIAARHYHAQLAFYRAAADAAQREDCPWYQGHAPCWIVAVESSPPHDVAVYRLPEEALEVGARKIAGWLDRVRECRASGVWPGVAPEAIDLTLPDWAATDGLDDVDTNELEGVTT